MATEFPSDGFEQALDAQAHDLDVAKAQAEAQIKAMTEAASTADKLAAEQAHDYSVHSVDGVGRYAVVRRSGWKPLLKVLQDQEADLNFSPLKYPAFDKVLAEHFPSPWLYDPLHESFWRYNHLRENLAAVRNFLMETYYVNTPPGMTPEKAKKALEEIAAYVGDGLYNNPSLFGLIPNHDPLRPHISIHEASKTGGDGAQYIYEKILEMHRQSSWLRPFSAVIALFGGQKAPDWMLPPPEETEFTALFSHEIAPAGAAATKPTQAEMDATAARIQQLETLRQINRERYELNAKAHDLDAVGNYLLANAATMDKVAHVSEPERRKAVQIAKDILRNLKINLGSINVMEGLNLAPDADLSVLRSVQGVAKIYAHLVAWGRTIDASIMQHPSILAATQAVGQMGYIAKLEALRMAKKAGNATLVQSLTEQMALIPDAFAKIGGTDKSFGALLEKVERGIDTLLNRLQELSVPGAKVGFTPGNELGGMNGAPIAGMSMQVGADRARDVSALNQQAALVHAAEENAARAAAARTHQQSSRERGEKEAAPRTQARPSIANPVKKATASARPASSTSAPRPTAPAGVMNPAQMQQQMRNNQLHHMHDLEEEQHHLMDMQRLNIAQAQSNAKKTQTTKDAMHKLDPNLLKAIGKATDMKGVLGPAVNPGSKGSHVASVLGDPHHDDKQLPPILPPHGPHRGGRGF